MSNRLDPDQAQRFNYQQATRVGSALDKLLGQLGIYPTWLSSTAYLQKQLHIFIFLHHIFFCDYTCFLIE